MLILSVFLMSVIRGRCMQMFLRKIFYKLITCTVVTIRDGPLSVSVSVSVTDNEILDR